MALHRSIWRIASSFLAVAAAIVLSSQSAQAQYTWKQDTDSLGNWDDPANWLDGGSNTTFPNGAGVTAYMKAPISSNNATYQLTMPASVTLGQLTMDDTGWPNTYSVNFISGNEIIFDSNSAGVAAKYIQLPGTSTTNPPATRVTINQMLTLHSDLLIQQDDYPHLNTGTTFTGLINGDSTKTITKTGVAGIQFNYAFALGAGEGFEGHYDIQGGTVRLINSSAAIARASRMTISSGAQLQLADNNANAVPDYGLAPGAVLNLNGNGAASDGALRFGITVASRTETFHNSVNLQSDSRINVALANTFGIIDQPVTGSGDLIKTGAGKLTLSAASSYAGDTQLNAGILSISNATLADAADVYLTTGSTFDLNFGATDTIRALYIDGVPQSVGTYGASGLGASFFTGSGLLNVTTMPVVGVPGDYNDNGVVDAGDYVLWRKGGPLAHEVDNPGVVNAQDYTEWRARFGNPPGSGSALGAASVPEPATILLVALISPFIAPLVARRDLGRTRS
jgi:autotransporter-associated beta strand protein